MNAHDLFLLMLTLAQTGSQERIIKLFIESLETELVDIKLTFTSEVPDSSIRYHTVQTINKNYGFIIIHGDYDKIPRNDLILFQNSIQMLAVILENRNLTEILQNEKNRLNSLTYSQAQELILKNAELKIINKKLMSEIEARRKIEEERMLLSEKLHHREKMDAIGQLAGGIAHDFNNQLAAIMGLTELIIAREKDNQEVRSFAEKLITSVNNASGLTSQLLSFARKGKIQSSQLDINKIATDVAGILKHTFDKSITIKTNLDKRDPVIQGDHTQIQNLLLNLCINARDAMPGGGEIIIKTDIEVVTEHLTGSSFIKINPGKYVKMSITDTGCGIPEEIQNRIFEPFFTTKPEGKGTGMGLSAVLGTVQSHNGTVSVLSSPGNGSTFSVYLPLSSLNDKGSRLFEHNVSADFAPARILLADDEKDFREISTDMLTDAGHIATAFPDGNSALEYYRQTWQYIDIVIMDMIMPGRNGKDTLIEMRKINPDLKGIISSGYSKEGLNELLNDNKYFLYLQKPYKKNELLKAIQTLMG